MSPWTFERSLLERAEQAVGLGSFEWDPSSNKLHFSENLYRLFGYQPAEVVPTFELVFDLAHPDDRTVIERMVRLLRFQAPAGGQEYRFLRRDGTALRVLFTASIRETEGRRSVLGTLLDVSEQSRAEAPARVRTALDDALWLWDTLELGGGRLLRGLCGAADFDVGALWLAKGDGLEQVASWSSRVVDTADVVTIRPPGHLRLGSGLLGRAIQAHAPIHVVDPGLELNGGTPVSRIEVGSALEVPIFDAKGFAGVIELISLGFVPDVPDHLLRALAAVGHELGLFLDGSAAAPTGLPLTPRELEILEASSYGSSARELADKFTISESTVRSHLEHVYHKLGVSGRAAAVAKALRTGLIE